ncbi:MAG: MiaB/RimO family radical SAM methylthiotransferase [Patescibacteria group bacterium]|nr:MiaB/RimO family radical SAM methylthiotransferase [Patescibacteria group bacterium]
MNISDSERIAQKLDELGYKSAPEKEADLVIVNACSVRQTAIDRIWGRIRKWQNNNKKVFITGCVLKADRDKFAKKNIHTFNIQELPKLQQILKEHSNILLNNRISSKDVKSYLGYFDVKPKLDSQIAYIPIMTGCDNFCSYCAVPYTRGREVSRPIEDIISEIRDILDKGFKNIMLLGQNVNSYKYGFSKLLKKVDELPNDFQFTFMSSNPHDMTDEIIQTFSELKKWPRELHLAMQSGDDEVLKKMNRKYTSAKFLKLVSDLKSQIPDIKLTTDIIVGFPGETKKQFENTVKICQKIKFEKAYVSKYSPRAGTVSAKLKDNVPKMEKKRRWLILDQLINN